MCRLRDNRIERADIAVGGSYGLLLEHSETVTFGALRNSNSSGEIWGFFALLQDADITQL